VLLQVFDHHRRVLYVVGRVIPIASWFDHAKIISLQCMFERRRMRLVGQDIAAGSTAGAVHSGNMLSQVYKVLQQW